jgi:serine/threonine protein kinase
MSQIGRYEIVRRTGTHGLGALYEAFDPVMNRPVKIRIAERTTDPGVSGDQARSAILFDAQQLAHLDHPNIVKVLSCDESDGNPFLVMEEFEGQPLSKLLAGGSTLAPEKIGEILKNVALGLDHAHSKGLIHRNLTPESVLVSEDGLVKISGFEIARPAQYLNSDQPDQDLNLLLDSIHYMSPELVKGDTLDAQSDQFSLVVITFQALTGFLPFRADSPITLMSRIVFEDPAIREAGFSPSVAAVFERALSKIPSSRYSSCSELASAFGIAMVRKAASLTRMAQQPELEQPAVDLKEIEAIAVRSAAQRSLLPWIAATALIVILAGFAAYFLLNISPAPPRSTKEGPAAVAPAPSTKKTGAVTGSAQPAAPNTKGKAAKTSAPRPPVAKAKPKEEKSEPEPGTLKLTPVAPKVAHD